MMQQLYDFLKIVDKDFNIPLSSRVNLHDFASKLAANAIVSAVIEKNEITGLVAIYCNNTVEHYAYIPLLAVKAASRGKRLSRTLMKSAISIANNNGFKTIGIHTENPIAIHLYESMGFKIIDDSERKYLELKL